MGIAEEETLGVLKTARQILRSNIGQHGGREFGVYGDSFMAEFDSPVEALRTALDVQAAIATLDPPSPSEQPLRFRIGIHVDDVIADAKDLFGDGVNLASRIQAAAPPGGIALSANTHEHVRRKIHLRYRYVKSPLLKNIGRPLDIYVIDPASITAGVLPAPTKKPTRTAVVVTGLLGGAAVMLLVLAGGEWGMGSWHRPDTGAGNAKPAVAVLPFATISQSDTEALFARGLADDVTIDLQRFPGIEVIGKDSVKAMYEEGGVRAVVETLKPDYMVSASVNYFSEVVKVNVSVIDSASNRQVWANRFEMAGANWYVGQEEMAKQMILHIAGNVNEQEVNRIAKKRGVIMDAYELRARAKDYLNESTREANENAKSFASQALELQPDFVEAYNDLAYAYVRDWQYGWSDDPPGALEKSRLFAEKALSLDAKNYVAHWSVATVALYLRDFDRSLREWRLAVELNPGDPDVQASMIDILVARGMYEEALARINGARQINPKSPSWYSWNLGYVYYMLGRYDEAITAIESIPEPDDIYLVELAASFAMRGRPGDDVRAGEIMRRVRAAMPDYSLDAAARQPFEDPKIGEHWLGGVRRAYELSETVKPPTAN